MEKSEQKGNTNAQLERLDLEENMLEQLEAWTSEPEIKNSWSIFCPKNIHHQMNGLKTM